MNKDTEAAITEAQGDLNTQVNVLRAYTQAISKYTEQFSSGYRRRFTQHLQKTLLQY